LAVAVAELLAATAALELLVLVHRSLRSLAQAVAVAELTEITAAVMEVLVAVPLNLSLL
jgi:hypothetical protein